MKRAILVLTVVLCAFPLVKAQTNNERTQSNAADEKEILRLEETLTRAWLKNDITTISSIVADDFQYWSFKGVRRNKVDLLRAVQRSEEGDTKIEDPVVRVYGDAAVYTARIIDSGKHANGEAFTVKTCITTIFVRRGGKWQMVADHETLLPEDK
jgi:ketosteroid isomerase-like protein